MTTIAARNILSAPYLLLACALRKLTRIAIDVPLRLQALYTARAFREPSCAALRRATRIALPLYTVPMRTSHVGGH